VDEDKDAAGTVDLMNRFSMIFPSKLDCLPSAIVSGVALSALLLARSFQGTSRVPGMALPIAFAPFQIDEIGSLGKIGYAL
jgi:hypothetical protein